MATVQLTVFKSEADYFEREVPLMVFESDTGDFEAEAPVSSASFELQSEDMQLHKWDVWLSDGKGINKHIKDNLQCVPQRTGVATATVQWMVLKSDAGVRCRGSCW